MADEQTPQQLKDLIKLHQDLADSKREFLELQGEEIENYDEAAAQAKLQLESAKELLRVAAQGSEEALNQAVLIEKKIKSNKDLSAQDLKTLQEKQKYYEDIAELSDEELKALKKKLIEQVKIANEAERERKAREKSEKATDKATEKFAKLLGFGTEFKDTMSGAFAQMLSDSGNLGKSLKKSFSPAKLGGFLALGIENIMFGVDRMSSTFVKSTGATQSLTSATEAASEEMRMMGLGMESAYGASQALMANVSAFRTGTEQTQAGLSKFVGVLTKAGISADLSSKSFQVFNKTLGLSIEESKAATISMVQFGRALNLNVNQFMSDFNALAPELAAHGSKMDKVFKDLAMTSQQTGISMQALMGVARQFDTFEGAAQATSRLNAILGGGYLNAVEMVYATESERLITLQKTLQLSGKSFDDLGRFEKKALAAAGGFSSVAEAADFFNTSLEVNSARMQEQAEQQEKMENLARRAMPILEEMKMAFMQIAINLAPVVEFMSDLVAGLSWLLGAGDGIASKIILIAASVGVLARSLFNLATAKAAFAQASGTGFIGPMRPGQKRGGLGGFLKGAAGFLGMGGLGALGFGLLAAGGIGYGLYKLFGGGSDEKDLTQGFATGLRPGDVAGPDLGGGMTVARVHKNETMVLPRKGATIHNAAKSAQFATRDDVNQSLDKVATAIASLSDSNKDKKIVLDGKVLGEWTDARQSGNLSILNKA